jgi:hypothetical protein
MHLQELKVVRRARADRRVPEMVLLLQEEVERVDSVVDV